MADHQELDGVEILEGGVAPAVVSQEPDREEERDREAAVDVSESHVEAVAQCIFVVCSKCTVVLGFVLTLF